MKPFKINRNTWHYKLNKNFFNECQYSMERNWEPRHNNFCSYWRATMFRAMFVAMLSVFICAVLFVLGDAVYRYPLDALKVVGVVVAIFALGFGGAFVGIHLYDRKDKRANKPDSLFVQRYKTYKSKVCPMVEYDS